MASRSQAAAQFLVRWALRVGLPLAGAGAMLHVFPYRAVAGGVRFSVSATLFTRSGLTADTTFGSWEFPHVDGLPVGVHVSPENVDVVKMAAAATQNPTAYVSGLREDFSDQTPMILAWLVGEALIGLVIGLVLAAAVNLALRYLRRLPPRPGELRRRAVQLVVALGVVGALVGYGAVSYNPHWARESRLTGTLGALELFPQQLSDYYRQQATAFDVLSGIASIQAELQQHIEQSATPATSFNIMFISDMHLAGTYPLVRQYAQNFDVSLVINTGDESQFGTEAELTPAYRQQIRDLTRVAPMIWLAGNHDSPATVQVMRSIPGVIVLGSKVTRPEGGFTVGGDVVDAYGLRVGAIPDPRVYGAGGDYGSNDAKPTERLERSAVDNALSGVSPTSVFDVMATHEPSAAAQIMNDLGSRVRQLNSGHTHQQNAINAVQRHGLIDLVEGSTGAGGIKEIGLVVPQTPVEFTIESVAADCQFTKLVRFQLGDVAASTTSTASPASAAQDVSASTLYLHPQDVAGGRTCYVARGVGAATPIS